MVDRYEAELKKLHEYYDANRDFFLKVAEREEMFKQFLELEVSSESFSMLYLYHG